MNKRFLAILIAAFATSPVIAGSLDVHGDIKVNGKTVIDGQGNYVGSLPSQVDYVVLKDYFNDIGLKKTYSTTQTSNGTTMASGVRTDDLTKDDVAVHTYQFNYANGSTSSWVNTETYLSENKWISEGYVQNEDGTTSGSSYTQVEKRNVSNTPEKIILGGTYLNYYQQVFTPIACEDNNEGRCDIEGGNYTLDRDYQSITNLSEIVFVVSKTNYSQGAINYDDCVIMQFSSSDPWTAVFCKGVGIVIGWNSGYSMELTGVEGSLKTGASPKSVSLHVPKITK